MDHHDSVIKSNLKVLKNGKQLAGPSISMISLLFPHPKVLILIEISEGLSPIPLFILFTYSQISSDNISTKLV